MRNRPIGVTILAVLAGAALVMSVVHFAQALGILPYFVGPVAIRDFSLWYVLMWGLMIWVWWWVVRALWVLDPSAWLFVVLVSGFNLVFDFTTVAFTPNTISDLGLSFVLNLAILGYAVMPGTKRAFDIQ